MIIIINLHAPHEIKDIDNAQNISEAISYALSESWTKLKSVEIDSTDSRKYLDENEQIIKKFMRTNYENFNVIMMGDFNDTNSDDFWQGIKPFEFINLKKKNSDYLRNCVLSSGGITPPNTCCTGEYSTRTPRSSTDNFIGDYILIDTKKMSYETLPNGHLFSNRVPLNFNSDSTINPTSDHLPVECGIIIKKNDKIKKIVPDKKQDYKFNVDKINNFDDFYFLVNFNIKTILELLFRNVRGENFIFFGDTALIYYIDELKLLKSKILNLDITLICKSASNTINFALLDSLKSKILTTLNEKIGNNNYRYFLYNLLKRANLITVNEKTHYISNDLFTIQKYNDNEYICIDLLLKNDLFLEGKFFSNVEPDKDINRICYPISKINFDEEGYIMKNLNIYNKENFIIQTWGYNYVPTLTMYLYYLLTKNENDLDKYINNNIEILKLMSKYENYKYEFILKNKEDLINSNEIFQNLNLFDFNYSKPKINIDKVNNNIIVNGLDILNYNICNSIDILINYIYNKTHYILDPKKNKPELINGTVPNYENFLKNPLNAKVMREYLTIITGYDKDDIINNYTSSLFIHINEYLYAINLGINKVDPSLDEQIKKMDNIFEKYGKDPYVEKTKDELNDTFYLYRFQYYNCYSSDDSNFLNLPTLNKDDIMYFPSFLSTSYSTCYDFKTFLHHNSYLLKIKVNKNNKNYIVINDYSNSPQEFEVLLNRGLYYKVLDINNTIVELKTGLKTEIKHVPTIELELIDDYDLFKNPATIQLINLNPTNLLKVNHDKLCIKKKGQIGANTYFESPVIKDSEEKIPMGFLGAGGNAEVLFFELMNRIYAIKFEPIFFNLISGKKEYRLYDLFNDTVTESVDYYSTAENLVKYEEPKYLNFANREINELLVMKLCNEIIELGISPCLPFMDRYYFCETCFTSKDKRFTKFLPNKININSRLINYDSEYCFLLLTKKYSKTLRDVYHEIDQDKKLIYAFHVLHGLYTMDYYFNIIHTDLHDKNVLLDGYNEKVNPDEYELYELIISGEIRKFYVPYIKSHAIVWDWGRASAYQDNDSYQRIITHEKGEVLDYFGTIYFNVFGLPGWQRQWVRNPANVDIYKLHYVDFFDLFSKFEIEPTNYTIVNIYRFTDMRKFCDYPFSRKFLSKLNNNQTLIGGSDVLTQYSTHAHTDTRLDKPYEPPSLQTRMPLPIIKDTKPKDTKPKEKTIKKDKYIIEVYEDREKPNYTELPSIIPVKKEIKIGNSIVKLSQIIMYPTIEPKNQEEEFEINEKINSKLANVIFPPNDSNYKYF